MSFASFFRRLSELYKLDECFYSYTELLDIFLIVVTFQTYNRYIKLSEFIFNTLVLEIIYETASQYMINHALDLIFLYQLL